MISGKDCLVAVTAALAATGSAWSGSELHLTDRFGRTVNDFGLVLVDWDGHLANPAIEFFVEPPLGATFPATVTVTGNGVRLYFNLPSSAGASGPGKTLSFSSAVPRSVKVSIFPDRDGDGEQYALTFNYSDPGGVNFTQQLGLQVVDQDLNQPLAYDILIDHSEDMSGFFDGAQERDILRQAAEDWAYFIADVGLDVVPAGAQLTWIWDWPLAWTGPPRNGHWTTNSSSYLGFLLYGYGIDTSELRSGGEPSDCCFHHSAGVEVPLRRSGGVEIEIKGNFNTLGWFLTTSDDDWRVSGNLGNEPNDLYSIAHHEFGHTFAFDSRHPGFAEGEATTFDDPAIVDYFGSPVTVNPANEHFEGVIDPASGRGIFGNEYFGIMPRRRWLITKLDILLLQAVGYTLRETSAFVPVSAADPVLPDGTVGAPYEEGIPAMGGIPFYDWTLDTGLLPPGLTLDRFTGTISGTPTSDGVYPFTVGIADYAGESVTVNAAITVAASPCPGDLDGDDAVGITDLFVMFGAWGPNPGHAADLNGDGVVGIQDLFILFGAWGSCP